MIWIATLSKNDLQLFLDNYYWIKSLCGLTDEIQVISHKIHN